MPLAFLSVEHISLYKVPDFLHAVDSLLSIFSVQLLCTRNSIGNWFPIEWQLWFVAHTSEEQWNVNQLLHQIGHYIIDYWKIVCPIILIVVHVQLQLHSDVLIHNLCLTVHFQMVSGWELQLDSNNRAELISKCRYKLRTAIRDNHLRCTIIPIEVYEKEVYQLSSVNLLLTWNRDCMFGQPTADNQNTVVTGSVLWHCTKIYWDISSDSHWHWQRLERSQSSILWILHMTIVVAVANISINFTTPVWPVEVVLYNSTHFIPFRVHH